MSIIGDFSDYDFRTVHDTTCWRLDTDGGNLIVIKITTACVESRQPEVTIFIAVPSPVDIEHAIFIAMHHECMSTTTVAITIVNNRTRFSHFIVDDVFPFLVTVAATIYFMSRLTKSEHFNQCTGLSIRGCPRRIKTIVHLNSLATIEHQPCNVCISHIVPVK